MKKLFLTLLGASMLIGNLQAQVTIGPKAGGTFASLGGANEMKRVFASYYGVMMQLETGGCYTKIQTEVVYTGEGGTYKNTNARSVLNYLKMPLLLHYTCKHCEQGFFAVTGPQFGLLLSANTKAGGNKTDVTNLYKATDLSWVFGIGYKTSFNLGIDSRYNMGLTDITKNDGQTIRNRGFQTGLFYTF